jgi:hypothetical protein
MSLLSDIVVALLAVLDEMSVTGGDGDAAGSSSSSRDQPEVVVRVVLQGFLHTGAFGGLLGELKGSAVDAPARSVIAWESDASAFGLVGGCGRGSEDAGAVGSTASGRGLDARRRGRAGSTAATAGATADVGVDGARRTRAGRRVRHVAAV